MILFAVLLGLRHATDPDHLTAVATLLLDGKGGGRSASLLGLAWGAGHGITLFALGAPFVLVGPLLPPAAHEAIEVAIGIAIVALSARLVVRWRRGVLHSHPHAHGGRVHAHPHVHDSDHAGAEAPRHEHAHGERLGRSPFAAFGLGLLHGAGGSAGAGVLVAAAAPTTDEALASLMVFAGAAALAMAAASFAFAVLARPALRWHAFVPALGVAGVMFGIGYALHALGAP